MNRGNKKVKKITISDGLTSMATKLGEKSNQRKVITSKRITDKELEKLYYNTWIGSKYVNKTSLDMLKSGRSITYPDVNNIQDLHNKFEKKYKIKNVFQQALINSSIYGDCIVLAITSTKDEEMHMSLSYDENLLRLIVLNKKQFKINKEDIEKNVLSKNYNNPKYYYITGDNNNEIKIHHSRLSRIKLGNNLDNTDYGISDFVAPYDEIIKYLTSTTVMGDVIEESIMDVYKLSELNEQISAGREDDIVKRIALVQFIKSSQRAILLDKEKAEFEQKNIIFTGIVDIANKLMLDVAGALDMPVTILFGQSPSGFNAGDQDTQNYYDTILSKQESRLRPLYDFIDKFFFNKSEILFNGWGYDFNSIETKNKEKEMTSLTSLVNALIPLVINGVIPQSKALEEIKARQIFYTEITDEDIDLAKPIEYEVNQEY